MNRSDLVCLLPIVSVNYVIEYNKSADEAVGKRSVCT